MSSLRTLPLGDETEFQVRLADVGVVARLICGCGRTLVEVHVVDADPDEVELDGGAALRERLLWGRGLVLFCRNPVHNGRMIVGRGGVSD